MKTSLVTGGGRGIGRAIARALAGPDTWVAVAGRTRSELDSAAATLRLEESLSNHTALCRFIACCVGCWESGRRPC